MPWSIVAALLLYRAGERIEETQNGDESAVGRQPNDIEPFNYGLVIL